MTTARIRPGIAVGRVRAPASKSYTHRALVAAHLAGRRYTIVRPLLADDTLRTVEAIGRLGSRVRRAHDRWVVEPRNVRPTSTPAEVDCGESGTTLRFACGLAALRGTAVRFVGRGRLGSRPIGALVDALRQAGAQVRRPAGRASLPLTICGPIHGGRVEVGASESSQFTSALLFALPTVRPDSVVVPRGPVVSAPYVAATIAVARSHRIRIQAIGRRYEIPGGQVYRGDRFEVPGDASSAAYLWAAAALTGGTVTVSGIPEGWPQADLGILSLLRRFGATVRRSTAGTTVHGRARRPFRVSLTDAPDLYPLAGVLAATAAGESRLLGAPHVAAKESNRKEETSRLARALGARVRPVPGGLAIEGTGSVRRFELTAAYDHRIVMSAAVAALAADGTCSISDARAVDKSFPEFFTALGGLVGEERVR